MSKNKKAKSKKINKKVFIGVSITIVSVLLVAIVVQLVKESNNFEVNNSQGISSSNTTQSNYSKIKFSEMYETINNEKQVSSIYKSFDGKEIEISGYMAYQSPLDESYIYLVNQPYVSCPFCAIGDITKLEIIPVYMANGSTIKYTENGVTIRGKLEVAEKVDAL